jgi:hypothetical protein
MFAMGQNIEMIHYSVPDAKKKSGESSMRMSQVALKYGLRINWNKAVAFLNGAPAKLQNDFRAIVNSDSYLNVLQAAQAATNGTYNDVYPKDMGASQPYFLQPNEYGVKRAQEVIDELNAIISVDASVASRPDVSSLKSNLETFVRRFAPENIEATKNSLKGEIEYINAQTAASDQLHKNINKEINNAKTKAKTAEEKQWFDRFVQYWYTQRPGTNPPTKTKVDEVIRNYRKSLTKEQRKAITLEQIYAQITGSLLALPSARTAPRTRKA